jgi:hypothetical protein
MMQPAPRSAIFGAIAATRKYADRTLLANMESEDDPHGEGSIEQIAGLEPVHGKG